MKQCTKCKEYKGLDDFNNNKNNKDRKSYHCKTCTRAARREWYANIGFDEYYKRHKTVTIKYVRKWQADHIEEERTRHARRNHERRTHKVKWHNTKAEHQLQLLKRSRKEVCHLDHIIPLKHDKICGLHVHDNLQILTADENQKKSNKWDGTYNNNGWE